MIRATSHDKKEVTALLAAAFEGNQSVRFVTGDRRKETGRIKLLRYSFEKCLRSGLIYLSDDRHACAMALFPEKDKMTLGSVLLDIRFIFTCVGLRRLKRVLARERELRRLQPPELKYYLWFIGVDPAYQNRGIGNRLLREMMAEADSLKRTLILETSTVRNLPWYEKSGFKPYARLDIGYPLYFLRKGGVDQ
jgi:ribosomal protein S18 acetylase RimI-like enzyme